MEIKLKEVTIKELVSEYVDNQEEGVRGFSGKLNIRPKYQREFVYKDKQRDEVIKTVTKNFPLNVMYWVDTDDGNFEVLDGQQRTISICQYVKGDFSINFKYFHNLTDDEQEQILKYKLMIYVCKGKDSEKLDWFKTINIAGEKLTVQELRNAVYTGSWLTHAKSIFSKSNCAAHGLASQYMNGSPIRQDYLETALSWINYGEIEEYMAVHQQDETAKELWGYFQSVFQWVNKNFINQDKSRLKLMKGQPWGEYYNQYKDNVYNASDLEDEIKTLLLDEEVGNPKGIYPFVLGEKSANDERLLSLRVFDDKQKQQKYTEQEGICPDCKKHFEIDEMQADHITPWSKGGKTTTDNLQMLCADDNRRKSNK